MAKAGRGDDQYMIRFPAGLRERVKAAADANGRSMNSEIISVLESYYIDQTFAEMLERRAVDIEVKRKEDSTAAVRDRLAAIDQKLELIMARLDNERP